jgi:hypothetical protein
VRRTSGSWSAAIGCVFAVVIAAAPAYAQLNTQHIKGTTGLKAGSMPPPHTYIPALYYVYARLAPQGSELTVMATFLVKPIELP